jgi:7,8-dihydropterin-6-yl-methyl-4-(beta-D-ribofuranosyl)aminobenzene 5'-phosphate synthase
MSIKICCLAENESCREGIGAEHGLSLYIEFGGKKILFDMGQSDLFLRNAQRLGVDLAAVDLAVLSHGHYDHGGGLHAFFKQNSKAPIYLSPLAMEPHYNGEGKYIGLDPALAGEKRFVFVSEKTSLAEGVTLFPASSVPYDAAFSTAGMTVLREGRHLPDDFSHEQYLLLEDGGQKILISGCSHRGIEAIAAAFSPQILIGGFHFSKFPLDAALAERAERLNALPICYYTCHCTGKEQTVWMKERMDRLFSLSSGDRIILE